MQKILLQTVKALLNKADDMWIDSHPCACTLSWDRPLGEAFLDSYYEDDKGLVFEYKAFLEDNAAATLEGHNLTLVGREEDGDTYDFTLSLLSKWDAEAYLGRSVK
jgi:hypothetical protein